MIKPERIAYLSSFVSKTINYLFVESIAYNKGRIGFSCRCICGNLRPYIKAIDIIKKKAVSCGCKQKEATVQKREHTIVGKKYNNLLVLSRTTVNSSDGYLHVCKCDCGNVISVKYNNLVRARVKSCGCLTKTKQEHLLEKKKLKLLNKRYSYLEVIDVFSELDESSNKKQYIALCKCHGCGRVTTVRANALSNNKRMSCGCKRKELLSLAAGGTGVPYENKTLQEAIRKSQENKDAVLATLRKYAFKCSLSNKHSSLLEVHHIVSLSSIINDNNITKDNWTQYTHMLFDPVNLVPLNSNLHRLFHKLYGYSTTKEQFLEFIELYKSNNIPRKYLK